jgi:hypothetical protein
MMGGESLAILPYLTKSMLFILLPLDYAKEMDRGGLTVTVPSKATLVRCLLKDSAEGCTEDDAKAVAFFYRVALTTVESKLIKSKALMEKNDVWGVLPQAMHWSSSMAYSLMLVEKMSDLTNIAHNYELRSSKKSDLSAEDDSDGGTATFPPRPTTPAKKMKRKIRVKESINGIVDVFYENNRTFQDVRMSKDKVAKNALRRRLMAWEKKVGIMGENGASAARKRRTVEPLQKDADNKLPRITDSIGFGERQKLMEQWNQEEDDEHDSEFWRDEEAAVITAV